MMTIVPSRRAAAQRADQQWASRPGSPRARTVWTRDFLTLPQLLARGLNDHPGARKRLEGITRQLFVDRLVTALEPEVRRLFGDGIGAPGAARSIEATLAALRMAGLKAADLVGTGNRRLTALAATLDAYERALVAAGWWDDADACRAVTGRVESGAWPPGPAGELTVRGLYDATPLQAALLVALARRSGRARIHIPFDPQDEDAHAYAFPYIHLWEAVVDPGLDIEIVFAGEMPGAERVRFVTADDPADEARRLADWALSLARAECPLDEIGVVVTDIDRTLPMIEREFGRRGLALSSARGQKLEETPYFAASMLPFRLMGEGLTRNDLMSWITSPLTAAFDPGALAAAIAAGPTRGGSRETWRRALSRARGASARALMAALAEIDGLGRHERSPAEFWPAYRRMLSMAGLDDPGPAEAWEEVAFELRGALEAIGRWTTPAVGWRTHRQNLLQTVGGRRAAEGRPGRGIFVSSPRDSRGLTFRHAAILGVSRGALVSADPSRAILGDGERRVLNDRLGRRLFRLAGEDAREGAILLSERIRATAGEVVISHPLQDGTGLPVLPALEFRRLRARTENGVPPSPHPAAPAWRRGVTAERVLALQQMERGRTAFFARDRDERRGSGTRADGAFDTARRAALAADLFGATPTKWSASRLETWRQCPHKFFGRYLLVVKPPEEQRIEADPGTVGRLVHEALKILYQESPNEAPRPAAVRDAVERAGGLTRAVDRGDLSVWQTILHRTGAVLERYITEVASSADAFRPEAFELEFGLKDAAIPTLPLATVAGAVALNGRLDRLDRDPQTDRLRVVDYKYTDQVAHHRAAAKPEECGVNQFQLYVYSLAAREWASRSGWPAPPAVTGIIHCVKVVKMLGPLELPTAPAVRTAIAATIEAAAGGQYDPSPRDEKTCRNCDYRRGCRIATVPGDAS